VEGEECGGQTLSRQVIERAIIAVLNAGGPLPKEQDGMNGDE
jgi:hypothetical protein